METGYAARKHTQMARTGWAFALLGGLAGGLAFEPFGLRFLIPLAPAGFFLAAHRSPTPGGAFVRVLAGGLVFYGIAISWLMTLTRFYPIVALGVPFVALYLALFPALAAWIVRRWFSNRELPAQFAAFGALWIFFEWLRTLSEVAFPWAQLGHAWAPWTWSIQLAEFFGELIVSAQILIIAGAIVFSVTPSHLKATISSRKWAATCLALAALMLAASALRGAQWAKKIEATDPARSLTVAVLQPNIVQEEKLASYGSENKEERDRLIAEHWKLHEEMLATQIPEDIDLLVMPESTFASLFFGVDADFQHGVEAMIAPLGADVLFGAARITTRTEDDFIYIQDAYNSAWYVPEGSPIAGGAVQDKMRLVPFGESLSFFRYIPFLKTVVGIGEWHPGEKVEIFESRGLKFGTLICFESSFGAQARKIANEGAEFLTVITNDGWYGRSAGAAQHHNLSLLRAVETRRPVVRAANTGISSIIDPAGNVKATLALEKRGVISADISGRSEPTLYLRWGNLGILLLVGIAMLATFLKKPG